MKSFLLGDEKQVDTAAMILRIGLGMVFIIGGWNKLYQLLDPSTEAAILASYMGSTGYINQFFTDYLFSGTLGAVLTPWLFLTTLSAFELVSGLMLAAGLLIRPLSLIWALLLWTFVISLPVVTTPGVDPVSATYTSPALLVQMRDVGLSGLFFMLYNLGSGRYSLDEKWNTGVAILAKQAQRGWNEMGLLLRISLALPFLVAGFFHGLDHIQTFKLPAIISVLLGLGILIGMQIRAIAIAVILAMVYYIFQKLSVDKSIIANLNGFKRELGFLAAGFVLLHMGGGSYYTPQWITKSAS